jgi:iron complex outermembrane recepter protein
MTQLKAYKKSTLGGISLRALASAAALISLSQPASALAQTTTVSPTSASDEIVIVTARKREETLQTVPLSVTTFSAKAIEARGLTSIADVATQTPGFSFRSGFGRTFDRPVIRGMATIQGGSNAAFFIDGVFVTGSIAGYGLDNLERIEIIKGPQSAQFGRSSFAGAINYITRKPGDRLRGKLTTTLGDSGRLEASGFLSGPLMGNKLKFEINARGYSFDGQYRNELDPGRNLGEESTFSYGAGLFFTPFEGLELSYRGTRIKDQDGSPAFALIGRTIGQTFPLPAGQLQTNGINCFAPQLTGALFNGRPVASARARGYWCGAVPIPSKFALNTQEFAAAGFPYALNREIERNTIKLDWDFKDWNFTATYGDNNFVNRNYTDQDYSDLRTPGFETYGQSGSSDKSTNIRIATPATWRIRGQLGYYTYEEKDDPTNFGGDLRVTVNGVSRAFTASDDKALLPRNLSAPGRVENTAWYGQLEVDITEKLRASVEVRSQTDIVATSGVSSATALGVAYTRSLDVLTSLDSVLPRYTLDYKLNDDVLIYGVAAKGNKPGGVNTGLYSAIYTDAQVAEFVSLGAANFKEEEIWSYEIGAKTTWYDNKLVLNAAAFYIDWTNQQLTQTAPVQATGRRDGILGTVAYNVNAGQSEIKGLEINAIARPLPWLELRFGYGLQATKIINFINDDQADLYITVDDIAALNAAAPPAPATATQAQRDAANLARLNAANALIARRGNAAGNELPRTPKHQVQLGATASQTLTNGIKMSYRADYTWEAKRFIQVDNLGWSKPLNLLNLRASAELSRATISLWMNNALDSDSPVDILRSIDTAQTIGRPRTRTFGAGTGAVTETGNIRDFLVTLPVGRTAGITLSIGF